MKSEKKLTTLTTEKSIFILNTQDNILFSFKKCELNFFKFFYKSQQIYMHLVFNA